MNVLHLDSSVLGENSASRELSAAIAARFGAGTRQLRYRDLDAEPIPHLSSRSLAGDDAELAEQVLQEFLEADVVVIGAPMYNFAIPSSLKAWIDRIAVAGKTFHYTTDGPQGLAGDKQVLIASTRGGVYGNGPMDFQENYLRTVFGFLGVTNIEFVRAEGLAVSSEGRDKAMRAAHQSLLPLAA